VRGPGGERERDHESRWEVPGVQRGDEHGLEPGIAEGGVRDIHDNWARCHGDSHADGDRDADCDRDSDRDSNTDRDGNGHSNRDCD
ncbi:MAG TPA: hypothetical protein VHS28_05275, partial [Chloroflexota bacterium]|nr:hypothetical protein [Chloroflexota bacterium]